MTTPGTDSESTLTDGELLGFDADGPVDVLGEEELVATEDEDSSESTGVQEAEEQPAEELVEEEPAAEDTTEGEIAADQGEETTGGFTWRGKVYTNQEAAEHADKSYEGTVNSWREKYDLATEELNAVKAQPAPSARQESPPGSTEAKDDGEPPTDPKALRKVSDAINPETFRAIAEDENFGLGQALKYVLEEFDKVQTHNLAVVNDDRLSVIEDEREEARMFNGTVETFKTLAARTVDGRDIIPDGNEGWTAEGGQPMYPELLTDGAFIERVSDRYLRGGVDGEYGVYLAVLAERDWAQYNSVVDDGPSPPEEFKPSELVNNGNPTPEPEVEEDQVLDSGPGPSPVGVPETTEGRIRLELTQAAQNGSEDDVLGYDA